MTDQDIIEIISGAMRRRVRYPTDEAAQHNANAVLAALRERYVVIPKVEIDTLWEMLIDYEQTVDGEWGHGDASKEQLREWVEHDLAKRLAAADKAEEGK